MSIKGFFFKLVDSERELEEKEIQDARSLQHLQFEGKEAAKLGSICHLTKRQGNACVYMIDSVCRIF